MGFPRQEPWSELLFSSPVDHSDPGIEFTSPALKLDYLLLGHQESHIHVCVFFYITGYYKILCYDEMQWAVLKGISDDHEKYFVTSMCY